MWPGTPVGTRTMSRAKAGLVRVRPENLMDLIKPVGGCGTCACAGQAANTANPASKRQTAGLFLLMHFMQACLIYLPQFTTALDFRAKRSSMIPRLHSRAKVHCETE